MKKTAVLTALISVLGWVVLGILEVRHDGSLGQNDLVGDVMMAVAFLSFALVGALILWIRPDNAVGWVFCGIGVLTGIGGAAQTYVELYLLEDPGSLGWVAVWITAWWWYPLLGLVMICTPFLFPTGRVVSRPWRFPFWAGVIAISVPTVMAMMTPRLAVTDPEGRVRYAIDNPIGVGGFGDVEESLLGSVFFALAGVSILAGVASLIVRFFRSRGVERQQLKWFALAASLIPINIVADEVFHIDFGTEAAFGIVIAALPIAAGLAILRYRLYDVDLVINRALVYGSLTAILAGFYVGIVFALQALLSPITAESDLAVAGSTLAVAALFRPVRTRVQDFIDRRFYRRKFDAHRTLEEFSTELRDEVDLAALSVRLKSVVAETMQPAHVSLWLREAR